MCGHGSKPTSYPPVNIPIPNRLKWVHQHLFQNGIPFVLSPGRVSGTLLHLGRQLQGAGPRRRHRGPGHQRGGARGAGHRQRRRGGESHGRRQTPVPGIAHTPGRWVGWLGLGWLAWVGLAWVCLRSYSWVFSCTLRGLRSFFLLFEVFNFDPHWLRKEGSSPHRSVLLACFAWFPVVSPFGLCLPLCLLLALV